MTVPQLIVKRPLILRDTSTYFSNGIRGNASSFDSRREALICEVEIRSGQRGDLSLLSGDILDFRGKYHADRLFAFEVKELDARIYITTHQTVSLEDLVECLGTDRFKIGSQ
jgi:hypothetical protein